VAQVCVHVAGCYGGEGPVTGAWKCEACEDLSTKEVSTCPAALL
jgi:hypothetical protein